MVNGFRVRQLDNNSVSARPEYSDVVAGLHSGSPDAWAALYDEFSVRVWRYVARLLGSDRDAVADVVQETFLAAARSAGKFDPERGNVGAWVMGIAHNQVSLHWRKTTNRKTDLAEPRFDDSPGGAAAPEVKLLTDDTIDGVRRVLAELPSDYAACLVAKYCDGESVEQMVLRFGGSTESVRSKLARARREFRRRYDSVGDSRNEVSMDNRVPSPPERSEDFSKDSAIGGRG